MVTGSAPGGHSSTVVPSSPVRPITASPLDPRASPEGYDGASPGTAGSSGPPPNGWRIHTPNSSPSVSANHQIHSPVGSTPPIQVPFGRWVTWRRSSATRSQAYISQVPVALDRYVL